MAETIKILGIYSPATSDYVTLYTVGVGKSAVVSTLTVCNTNAFAVKIRIHVVLSGSAEVPANAIYYDLTIPANDTLAATLGITMATGDFIRVYADHGNVTFFAFGTEIG